MSTDDFLMPTSYVAELNPTGSGTMYLTVGRATSDSVYVHLPIGVSTIQVSWNGAAQIRAQARQLGGFVQNVGLIPAGTEGAVRMMSFQVSVDREGYRLNLISSSEGSNDVNYRAGIVVIPISPPPPAGGG